MEDEKKIIDSDADDKQQDELENNSSVQPTSEEQPESEITDEGLNDLGEEIDNSPPKLPFSKDSSADADLSDTSISNETRKHSFIHSLKNNKFILPISIILNVILVISLFCTLGTVSKKDEENEELTDKNVTLSKQLSNANSEISELNDELDEIENGKVALLRDIKLASEDKDWDKVVSLYNDLHKKYVGTSEDTEAKEYYDKAKTELDKIAKAEQEKKEQEEKERQEKIAKGYETGITFDQIARNPEKYKGEKVKFTGEVIQIIYDSGFCAVRLAVNRDYSDIIYCTFFEAILDEKILEDDIITIYGTAIGEYSYESTMGKPITLPEVFVDKIDQ